MVVVAAAAARAYYYRRRDERKYVKVPKAARALSRLLLLLLLSNVGVYYLVNVVPATNTNQPTQKPQLDRPHQIKPQLCVVISPRFIAGRLCSSPISY